MSPAERIAQLESQLLVKDAVIQRHAETIRQQAARIEQFEREVAKLTEELAKLRELLGQHSGNSHRPPSSDPPGKPGKGKRPCSKPGGSRNKPRRKRGGQKGHRGAHRELLPQEQVSEVVDLFPKQCEHCTADLPQAQDIYARRYQTVELPAVKPHVTEYRRHEVRCPCCRRDTLAEYDATKIPRTPFGPRLMSVIATLTGVYHLSRRRTVELLSELMGVRLSLGAVSAVEERVSEVLEPAFNEAWEEAKLGQVKYSDGTTWLQAGKLLALWTIATSTATVFKILASGTKAALSSLHGEMRGILVSDRAAALTFWAMEWRQICWAHLARLFISFSERDGPAGAIGRELLDYMGIMFEYWHQCKEGKLSRKRFIELMNPLQRQVELVLRRAIEYEIPRLSGPCANILEHRSALWTFVHHEGVEPTNNCAEQTLRAFVLWRRKSFGTQSRRGNLFAERIMTVAFTARKQGKNILGYLTACCQARLEGHRMPSLIEAP